MLWATKDRADWGSAEGRTIAFRGYHCGIPGGGRVRSTDEPGWRFRDWRGPGRDPGLGVPGICPDGPYGLRGSRGPRNHLLAGPRWVTRPRSRWGFGLRRLVLRAAAIVSRCWRGRSRPVARRTGSAASRAPAGRPVGDLSRVGRLRAGIAGPLGLSSRRGGRPMQWLWSGESASGGRTEESRRWPSWVRWRLC